MNAANAPIGCRDAIARLWDYLDGSLDPHHHNELEAHLAWCVQCCGELEFARHLRAFIAERTIPTIPPDVRGRLDRFVDELPVAVLDDPSDPSTEDRP